MAAVNRRVTVPGGVKIEPLVVENGNELVSWKQFMRRWAIATAGAIWSCKEGGGVPADDENDTQKGVREGKEKEKLEEVELMKGSAFVTAMGKVGFECLDEWDLAPDQVVFSSLIVRFEQRFARQQTALVNRHRIMRLEQGQGEGSVQFFMRIKNLMEICDWGSTKSEFQDRLMVTVGIAGLNDEELRTNLLTEQTLDWTAMKTRCDQWEGARVTTKVMGKPEFEEVAAVASRPRVEGKGRERESGLQCHSCNEYGHFARDCEKRACYLCGGKGHLSYNCPRRLEGGQGKKGEKMTQKGKATRVCTFCAKPGHGEDNCWAKRDQQDEGAGARHVMKASGGGAAGYGSDSSL